MFVRAAQIDDAAGIASVHVRAWQVGYRGIAPDSYLDHISLGERVTMWDKELASLAADRVILVAEENGTVVGFGGGGPTLHGEENAFQLYALNVDPAHWGMGVGGAIVACFTTWCVERGARELVLWVAEGNARARGFYERRGMGWDGTIEDADILGMRVRECRYRKALPRP